jgi:sulfatase maturation enzyme AslB (radical SAM superfamily)
MLSFQGFDKTIYFAKILIGEKCPLRCTYCFVDKESENVISEKTLFNFIDLLLFSKGNIKLLHLLWWEPLLHKPLLKKGVLYARKLAEKLGKDLTISFCTSGILFDEDILQFVAKHNIKLAWSIDGPKHIHDNVRKLKNWQGSFDLAIKHKNTVFGIVPDRNLWLAIVVKNDFQVASELFESFRYLVEEEWFTSMQISPMDGSPFPKDALRAFIENYKKIHEYIIDNIKANKRWIYINTMNKEFRYNMLTTFRHGKWRCIWFYLDWWVNGDIVFDPFVHKDDMHSRKHVVGNVNSPTLMQDLERFIGCTFDKRSKQCIDCHKDYFSRIGINNAVIKYRDYITIFYANKIRKLAETDERFARYILEAKEQMYV